MDTLSATLLLLTVMDPLGNVRPSSRPCDQYRPSALPRHRTELIIALVILLVSFLRQWLMSLLHLQGGDASSAVASCSSHRPQDDLSPALRDKDEPALNPHRALATPMVAGPSCSPHCLYSSVRSPNDEPMARPHCSPRGPSRRRSVMSPILRLILKEKGAMAVERLMACCRDDRRGRWFLTAESLLQSLAGHVSILRSWLAGQSANRCPLRIPSSLLTMSFAVHPLARRSSRAACP